MGDALGAVQVSPILSAVHIKPGRSKDEKVTIVTYPPRRSIFDVAFGRTPESVFESRIPPVLKALNSWRSRMSMQGVLRIMPYTIELH